MYCRERFLQYSIRFSVLYLLLFGLTVPAWSLTVTGTIVSIELTGPAVSDIHTPPMNSPSSLTAKITLANNQSPGWLVVNSPYRHAMLMGVLASYAMNEPVTITGIEACGCSCTIPIITTIEKLEFD